MLKKHYDQIRHRQIRPPTIITNSFNVNPNKKSKPNPNRSTNTAPAQANSNIRQVQPQPKLFNLKCNLPKQNLRIFDSAQQKSTPNPPSQNKPIATSNNSGSYQIKVAQQIPPSM